MGNIKKKAQAKSIIMACRRWFAFLCGLCWTGIVLSQDVVVTLAPFTAGIPTDLTFITVENVSRNCSLMLNELPEGQTVYRINLSQGRLEPGLGIPPGTEPGYTILVCEPGRLRFSVVFQTGMPVTGSVIDMNGRRILQEEFNCLPGVTEFETFLPVGGMYVVEILGQGWRHALRCAGSTLQEGAVRIVSQTGRPPLAPVVMPSGTTSKLTEFTYEPGDLIRFRGYRNGYYPGLAEHVPLTGDVIPVFLSAPCPGNLTVADIDGNTYQTVQIGNQCWMRQNLNVTHTPQGVPLVDGTGVGSIFGDFTTPYWFNYNDSAVYSYTYGKLYTWAAVMNGAGNSNNNPSGVQGICPDGWHVPSDEEWIEMEMFLGMSEEEAYKKNDINRGTDEGGKLKSSGTELWLDPNVGGTNESGFHAIPAGYRMFDGFTSVRFVSHWWTSTGSWRTRIIFSNYGTIIRTGGFEHDAYSLRCVKD